MFMTIVIIVGTIFTGVCGFGAYYYYRKLKELQAVPLSYVDELDEGMGKIMGEVIAEEEPIKAPIGGKCCVYYSITIEKEEVREVPHERMEYRGGRQVRIHEMHTERTWVPVLNEEQSVSFAVKDETGSAAVEMDKAHAVLKKKSRLLTGKVSELSDKGFNRLCNLFPSIASTLENKKCRYTQSIILEEDTLLILGPVTFMKDDRPLFAHEKKKTFIVSDQTDEQLQQTFKTYAIWLGIASAVFLIGMIVGIILLAKK